MDNKNQQQGQQNRSQSSSQFGSQSETRQAAGGQKEWDKKDQTSNPNRREEDVDADEETAPSRSSETQQPRRDEQRTQR